MVLAPACGQALASVEAQAALLAFEEALRILRRYFQVYPLAERYIYDSLGKEVLVA